MIGGSMSEAAEAQKYPVGSMSEGISEAGGSMSEEGYYKKEPKKARTHARLCGHVRVAMIVPIKEK